MAVVLGLIASPAQAEMAVDSPTVIELFTSQGCSSCPPADRLLKELSERDDILALAPFGKVPVLESAVEEWATASDYFANYSEETLAQIANGYDTMQRWLFRPDYDATQRAVIGDIEGRLLVPTVLSNIAIEGVMTPEEGAAWLQEQVDKAIQKIHGRFFTRECPFCAEIIKKRAKICKHCQKEVAGQ